MEANESVRKQQNRVNASRKVDISSIKEFAASMPDCALKEILLSEETELDIQTFLARFPLYLKLSENPHK